MNNLQYAGFEMQNKLQLYVFVDNQSLSLFCYLSYKIYLNDKLKRNQALIHVSIRS